MSPENVHKLMGFYIEVLILSVILQYMVSAAFCRVYRVNSRVGVTMHTVCGSICEMLPGSSS